MKLELKHLASYLPYKLKVASGDWYDEDCKLDRIGTMVMNYDNYTPNNISINQLCGNIDGKFTIYGVIKRKAKPILRPLSDLTKDIDGVVHLVELAKIEHPCSIYHSFTGSSVEVAGNENNSLNFRFDFDNEFFINSEFDCDDIYYPVMYQLELYEYLFKNHFDVYGLIEKGLAIDVNMIENV